MSEIVELFWRHVDRWPARAALRHVIGGEWRAITWSQYGEQVAALVAGLAELGVEPGDRVGILGANSVRWHQADLAVMSAAATTVPVYATNVSSQVAYVLGHSKAKACFVQDRDQLAKVLLRRNALPALERVFVFDGVSEGLDDDFVVAFDDVVEAGRDRLDHEPGLVLTRRKQIQPSTIATIVYTNGTTGPPKGAMLTHANLGFTIDSITAIVEVGPDDRFLSFLPLSHIAERIVSDMGQIVSGGETWFARSLADVPEDLRACRPTIFFAVPRVWQKFHDAICDKVAHAPAPIRRLFDDYLTAGLRDVDARESGIRRPVRDRARYVALDRTLGALLRRAIGLDRARYLVSSAAPVSPDLLRWFHAIGLRICEVYGQTEDCGPTTAVRPGELRLGSVGRPIPGVEVRLAADGEVLVRGGNVCAGYLDDPVATRELVDADGWMHSGDLGLIDPDGFLRITGRKKDLIINAAGKNIAPQELETALQAEPLISQAVVIGEGRPYLIALLTLDDEQVHHWADSHGKLVDGAALHDDPDLQEMIGKVIERLNAEHAPVERIRRWRILPREFTVATGELTPTLKVKRGVVNARYADLIDEIYAAPRADEPASRAS